MLDTIREISKLRILFSGSDRRWYVLLLFATVAGALLEAIGVAAIPLYAQTLLRPAALSENALVRDLLGQLPEKPTLAVLSWASGLLIAFMIARTVALTALYYLQATVIRRQTVRLRDRVFRAYQLAPYDWLTQRGTSDLIRNIQNDTSQMFAGIVVPCLDLVMALIMSVFIFAVMMLGAPLITMLSFALVAAGVYLTITRLQKWLRKAGETVRNEYGHSIKATQQAFGSVLDARIAGCEDYLAQVHHESLVRLSAANRVRQTIMKATPGVLETIATGGLLLVVLVTVTQADSAAAAFPALSMLVFATVRLKQMMTKVTTSVNMINTSLPTIPEVVNDYTYLQDVESQARAKRNNEIRIGAFEELRVSGVTYQYPSAPIPALRDLTLDIRSGESIGLVGPTGCGKSTLVNVILGLLEPQHGQVLVNGTDIHADLPGWRANLGYIPQSVFLLDDTIRANVAFGVSPHEIDDSQVWRCLRWAWLEEFVRSQPGRLDATIGERGVRMSGGQRQRLGIARALYRSPAILVMDEATSALDNQTESEVMGAIRGLRDSRTLIMIAHRLGTVKDCDRLYLIRDGSIDVMGTYDQLFVRSNESRDIATGKP